MPGISRAFLMENYEEFESKIRTLCNDSSFMSYVADSQFDSAYTKMVYGGTSSYTEDELIGNYKGTQGEKSTFITKNSNGAYTANSMLDNVTYYQNKGVSLDKIYVNDEYISGYSSSGIMKSKEKQPDNFKTWLKASYYNTAFYFCILLGLTMHVMMQIMLHLEIIKIIHTIVTIIFIYTLMMRINLTVILKKDLKT